MKDTSLPGNRILWRTISPMMQPTDQISTAGTEVRKRERRKKERLVLAQTVMSDGREKELRELYHSGYG